MSGRECIRNSVTTAIQRSCPIYRHPADMGFPADERGENLLITGTETRDPSRCRGPCTMPGAQHDGCGPPYARGPARWLRNTLCRGPNTMAVDRPMPCGPPYARGPARWLRNTLCRGPNTMAVDHSIPGARKRAVPSVQLTSAWHHLFGPGGACAHRLLVHGPLAAQGEAAAITQRTGFFHRRQFSLKKGICPRISPRISLRAWNKLTLSRVLRSSGT